MQNRFKFRFFEECFNKVIPCDDYDLNEIFNSGKIVMQCTGKKDKHNKLIYEGDIVRLTGKNKVTFEYVVKYRLSEYRYVLEYTNGKLKGHKARDFSKEYAQVKNLYDGGYEVIGNIYENPELLEGK